jgi:hypothetical protein
VLGCALGCGGGHETFTVAFTALTPCMCKCISWVSQRFKCGGGTAVPPLRPPRLYGPRLNVINKDRAQEYAATADLPDRPLAPGTLWACPPIPSLTCAVPHVAGCCLGKERAWGGTTSSAMCGRRA